MISDPDFFLDEFAEAGSDSFLVHWEGNHNLHRTVQRIRALGKRVGVAINPATGCGGAGGNRPGRGPGAGHDGRPGIRPSTIHPDDPAQDRRVRELIDGSSRGCELEVDGGIDATTAPLVFEPAPPCWWPARQSLVGRRSHRSYEAASSSCE